MSSFLLVFWHITAHQVKFILFRFYKYWNLSNFITNVILQLSECCNIVPRRDFTNIGPVQHCTETWFYKCRTVCNIIPKRYFTNVGMFATLYWNVILQVSDCLQHCTETWFYKCRTVCNNVPKRDYTNVGLLATLYRNVILQMSDCL